MKGEKQLGLYLGPAHSQGGIPVTVNPGSPVAHSVEVEGVEYLICADAYNSTEKLNYVDKTNLEILNDIHTRFGCSFKQAQAQGSDFIICKPAIKDTITKHSRSGTVREILDQIQSENGCRLSNGRIAGEAKDGGQLRALPPFDLTNPAIAKTILDAATIYPGNTVAELKRLKRAYMQGISVSLLRIPSVRNVLIMEGRTRVKCASIPGGESTITIDLPCGCAHELKEKGGRGSLSPRSVRVVVNRWGDLPLADLPEPVAKLAETICLKSKPHKDFCLIAAGYLTGTPGVLPSWQIQFMRQRGAELLRQDQKIALVNNRISVLEANNKVILALACDIFDAEVAKEHFEAAERELLKPARP